MKKGFSTLFIVIVLGTATLGLVLVLSTSSLWSIRSSVISRDSSQASALANACVDVALDNIRTNNSFLGTGNATLNGNTCSYSISDIGGQGRSVYVSAMINNIARKIQVNTSTFNPLVISSWQEVQ